MEQGVDREWEHGEGSRVAPYIQIGMLCKDCLEASWSWCAFWPWGSREDVESAALTFQPAFSMHFNRYSWYTPNIWLGTPLPHTLSAATWLKYACRFLLIFNATHLQVHSFVQKLSNRKCQGKVGKGWFPTDLHKECIAYPKWERELFPISICR